MKRNELLKRTEVEMTFDAKVTPSRSELQKKIAAKQNANIELTVIKKIETQFGKSGVNVLAHIYDTKKDLIIAEPKYFVEKNKVAEAPAKVEEPVKAEEAPAKKE